jgi:beta-lactamase regulating signal transducer with metallopeptidase domain
MFSYLLKMIVISAICYGWYLLALRNKRMHQYNRFYLLMSVVAAIFIPLLQLNWFTLPREYTVAFTIAEQPLVSDATTINNSPITGNSTTGADWTAYLSILIGVIALCLLILLLYKIIRVLLLTKQYPTTKQEDHVLVHTNMSEAPFSFFHFLFWRNDLALQASGCKEIMEHELTHIRQKHSYDKLFMQVVTAICWCNPIFWLMEQELETIHEFIADQEATQANGATDLATMLLQANYGQHFLEPTHSFFHSSIKRRFTMLNQPQATHRNQLRQYMIIPVLAGCLGLFAFSKAPIADAPLINAVIDTVPNKKAAPFVAPLPPGLKNPGKGINEKEVEAYNQFFPRLTDPANSNKFNNGLSDQEVNQLMQWYKDMNEQQRAQAKFLLMKASGPMKKEIPSATQIEKWKDASVYGVWINEKKVSNTELDKYKPSDFSHYFASKLYGAAKKGRSYAVQLNLMTNDYYEQYVIATNKSLKEKANIYILRKKV